MSHTLKFDADTYTIYVDTLSNKNSQVIAEHQILDATYTTMQYMGAKSLVKSIQFYFEDAPAKPLSGLVTYVNSGWITRYTDDTSTSGSYVITEFTHARVQALNQTNPWYRCSMTMIHTPASGSLYYQWIDPLAPPR